MADTTASPSGARAKVRPGTMRLADALQYRLPLAGWVSILHRASGLLMFALLPLVIWLFDTSISSEISYTRFVAAFGSGPGSGIGWLPGWLVQLAVLGLIWACLHHAIAGLRHVWMDATHSVSKAFGRSSAIVTLAASVLLTLVLGARLYGLY